MEWNQKRARETLRPFVETAQTVRVNSRKPYSPAGGRKRKGAYIDSYCAIKVPGLNATFNCLVEKQGDEPRFSLRQATTGGTYNIRPLAVFDEAELGTALRLWREIAQQANRPIARQIASGEYHENICPVSAAQRSEFESTNGRCRREAAICHRIRERPQSGA